MKHCEAMNGIRQAQGTKAAKKKYEQPKETKATKRPAVVSDEETLFLQPSCVWRPMETLMDTPLP